MNRLVMTLLTASLTACAATPPNPPASAPAAPVATLGSGLDTAGFDRAVRPQDDLFRFVNGKWLETTPIPADRSNYGAFVALDDQAQADLREIVEAAAQAPARAPGSDTQKIGDFYASFMDAARADALGLQPLAPELARIDALRDRKDLNNYFGYSQRLGVMHPIWLYVAQDEKNTTAYIPYVYQRGLTLPDRDYYLKNDEKFVAIRAKYLSYVTQVLEKARVPDAAAGAQRIMALETRLADAHWTRVQNRDAETTYNRYNIAQAQRS